MDLRAYARDHLPPPLVQTLRAARYQYEVWTFPRRAVSHQYGPYRLTMHIHDRVAAEWYDHDWELPPEMEVLRAHGLGAGALVFDLGAHQCLIAMMLAKIVGAGGKIVAVEANKHNAHIAALNIETNDVANVDVLHALVSNKTGQDRATMTFNSGKTPGAVSIGSDLVDSISIDELSRQRGWPRLVYMDIEGFEIEALRGAGATLRHRPTWFIELHGDETLAAYGARNADVLRFFPASGYDAYVCRQTEATFHPLRNPRDLPSERCFTVFVPTSPGD